MVAKVMLIAFRKTDRMAEGQTVGRDDILRFGHGIRPGRIYSQ